MRFACCLVPLALTYIPFVGVRDKIVWLDRIHTLDYGIVAVLQLFGSAQRRE